MVGRSTDSEPHDRGTLDIESRLYYAQMSNCVESALLNPVVVQGSTVFRRETRQDLLINWVQDLRHGVKHCHQGFWL